MKRIGTFLVMMAFALLGLRPVAQAQTCAAPTNVSVSPVLGTTNAVVSFTPSASALSYTVRYYWVGDSTTAGIFTVNTTTSPVTLTGLRTGAGAYYRVAVMSNCAGGFTTASPWITFLVGSNTGTGSNCSPPANATVATTSTTATIAFTAASGAGSYRVIYYAVGDSTNAITRNVTGSPMVLSGLLPNTAYIARIFSNCSGATSAATLVTFRTQAAAITCGAVTNVVVTATSASTATVSFTPGSNNTRFTVTYYVPNDSSRWVVSNASHITLTGLVPGRTYTIQVTSTCGTATTVTYTAGTPLTYTFRGALANRAALGAGTLSVFPNPAQRATNIVLPVVPGAAQARITLFNSVGQPVRVLTVPLLQTTETHAQLDLAGIRAGLYTLRVQAGDQSAAQRLAIE